MTGPLLVGPDRFGRKVAIEGGRIVAEPAGGAVTLPCPGGEIGPGAVCAHTHLYSGLARFGLPKPESEPRNFLEILEQVWWRLDRALNEDSLAASADDYVAQALLAGTTTLIDHHESPNLIEGSLAILQRSCEGLGMRAMLCYGATERNGGLAEADRGLAECERVENSPLIRRLVGLHAGFTVSDETIVRAGALARRLETVLHVHVAEDAADVVDAKGRGYDGPLERLIALDALIPGSILAHGVHLGPEQVRTACAKGGWFVQNPRSNEGNRVGYATSLQAGANVALGTDGWNADMAEEERALKRLAAPEGDGRANERLPAGARLVAQRFDANPQPLAPGALGDLVVHEAGKVRHVVVGGRVVVADGRLVSGDLARIGRTAEREAGRLNRRMAMINK